MARYRASAHAKEGEADAVALVAILRLDGHIDRARALRDARLDGPGPVDLERDRLVAEQELRCGVHTVTADEHGGVRQRRVRSNAGDVHGVPFECMVATPREHPQQTPTVEPTQPQR